MTELAAYKPPDSAKPSQAAAVGGDGSHVTYQLYYRPEQAKFSNNARVGDREVLSFMGNELIILDIINLIHIAYDISHFHRGE